MKIDFLWTYAKPVISLVLILVAGRIVINYLVRLLGKVLEKTDLDKSLVRFLKKAVTIVGFIVVVMAGLSAIGVSTAGILAVFSGCAVAIGVALKDSLSNVAGGILLLLAPRFATGDFIEADGDEGTVLEVDLLHTSIRTPDGKQISIPNGALVNSHITNYTAEKLRRVDLTLPIPYDADAPAALRIAADVISRHPLALCEPDAPLVRVGGYAENAVQITLRVWCNTENYWPLRFDLLEQLRAAFLENGISMPFNQLDVRIRQ